MKNTRSSFKKFEKEDRAYLSERNLVAQKVKFNNLFDVADHFGLYSGTQTIGRALAVYELVKQTILVPGNILEFGCWKGGNLLLMAKIIRLIQPNTIKEIYGFDSFAGLQTVSERDNLDREVRGEYCGDEDVLNKFIELYGFEDWVHLVKGDVLQTIKPFAEKNSHTLISLAYLDLDLYLPTKEALDFVHKNLSIGGLIVFDEAMTHDWQGEGLAMNEFLKEHEGKYEMNIIPFVRQPTVVLRRNK